MTMMIGTPILYGNMPEPELPTLPDGFRYDTKPDHWVLAIAPNGDVYYVSETRLYPRRQRKETGTFFIDTQNGTIELAKE